MQAAPDPCWRPRSPAVRMKRTLYTSRSLCRRGQAPFPAKISFDDAKNEPVDGKPNENDDHHHCHHLADVIEVAPHHQKLTQAETDENHFSREERAPSEGPALFQAGDQMREAGGQEDVQKEPNATRAEIAAGHGVDSRNVSQAGLDIDADGEQRAHNDDKKNRFFAQSEPEDRQWQPANTRHALHAHDEAAKGLLQEITLRKKQPQRAAKDDGKGVAHEHAFQADADADPKRVIRKTDSKGLEDAGRSWKYIRRPELQERKAVPKRQHNGVEADLSRDLTQIIHDEIQLARICRFLRKDARGLSWTWRPPRDLRYGEAAAERWKTLF